MKAGLITFHRANNIGAQLQTYALYTYVNRNVCDIEVIDYAPNNLRVDKNEFVNCIKNIVKVYLRKLSKSEIERRKKFEKFRKNRFKTSDALYLGDKEIFRNPPKYDLLISGSDQILNLTLSGESKAYYLGFSDHVRKVTYGSSFGRSNISEEEISCIRTELPKFSSISCREIQAKNIIDGLINSDCELVVDPVFLLDINDWKDISHHKKVKEHNYIFVYAMEVNALLVNTVEAAKSKYNLPVIVVYGGNDKSGVNGFVDNACGPDDFINYIENSSLVLTNSFHGASLALIFGKKLITVAHSLRNDRLSNLYSEIGSEDKLINNIDNEIENYIVYGSEAIRRLDDLIASSKKFISSFSDNNSQSSKREKTLQIKKEDCTGCLACVAVCPANAINIEIDSKGFSVPKVNEDLCLHCNLCNRTCPINKESDLKNCIKDSCYGFKSSDDDRLVSSSGAFFSCLARTFINQGNSVCIAAGFDSSFKVIHSSFSTFDGIAETRGSKYSQSDFLPAYVDALNSLNKGKKVLVVGTPCQISGLKLFLKNKQVDQSNLLTVDIVCHGVSSPEIWKECVSMFSDKYGKVKNINFRDKSQGWRGYHISALLDNGENVKTSEPFMIYSNLLQFDLLIRPNCFHCKYCSLMRCGDITIGDFWDIGKVDPDFKDDLGVSMVISNTQKGEEWLRIVSENSSCKIKQYDINLLAQHNLFFPTEPGFCYEKFWLLFNKYGLLKTVSKLGLKQNGMKKYMLFRKVHKKLENYKLL